MKHPQGPGYWFQPISACTNLARTLSMWWTPILLSSSHDHLPRFIGIVDFSSLEELNSNEAIWCYLIATMLARVVVAAYFKRTSARSKCASYTHIMPATICHLFLNSVLLRRCSSNPGVKSWPPLRKKARALRASVHPWHLKRAYQPWLNNTNREEKKKLFMS